MILYIEISNVKKLTNFCKKIHNSHSQKKYIERNKKFF